MLSKSFFLIIIISSAILISGCKQNTRAEEQLADSTAENINVKNKKDEIIVKSRAAHLATDSTIFLTVPTKYFNKTDYLHNSLYDASTTDTLKAIVWRFYKQVKLEKGLYVLNVTSGKDIAISEDVFKIQKNNLAQQNAFIKKNSGNKNFSVPAVSTEYLNSLIH